MSDLGNGGRDADDTVGILLDARQIVKKFGEFAANDDVSLTISPGQIPALLGASSTGAENRWSSPIQLLLGGLV